MKKCLIFLLLTMTNISSGMLSEALTAEDYTISAAYSGTETLMLLSKEKQDLILLDLMLIGLSGDSLSIIMI